jgi:hypothetical protein
MKTSVLWDVNPVVWYTHANLLSPSLGYVSAIEVMDYDRWPELDSW